MTVYLVWVGTEDKLLSKIFTTRPQAEEYIDKIFGKSPEWTIEERVVENPISPRNVSKNNQLLDVKVRKYDDNIYIVCVEDTYFYMITEGPWWRCDIIPEFNIYDHRWQSSIQCDIPTLPTAIMQQILRIQEKKGDK